MIYCSSCGTANRDGSRFCNECGSRLGAPILCQSCGFENQSTARFCNGCGAPITLPADDSSATGQLSTTAEDGPPESDVPSAFDLESAPDVVANKTDSLESFDFDVFADADATMHAAVDRETDSVGGSDADLLLDEVGDDAAQSIGSLAQQLFEDLPADQDILNDGVAAASIVQEEESAGGLLDVDEVQGDVDSLEDVGAESRNALPSWLLEDDRGAAGDFHSNGSAHWSDESFTSEKTLGSEVQDGAGIVLSEALASKQRMAASDADSTALTDAGRVFEMAVGQPWQAMPSSTQPERPAAASRTDDRSDKKKSSESSSSSSLLVIAVVLLLFVAVFSYIYIGQPGLVQSLSKTISTILEELISLISRFIK